MYYITSVYQDQRINCLKGRDDQLLVFKTHDYISQSLNLALNHKLLANLPHHNAIQDVGNTGWTQSITHNIPFEFERYFRYCELGYLFNFTDDSPVDSCLYEIKYKNRLINESHLLHMYDYLTTHQLLHTHDACSKLLYNKLRESGLDLHKIGFMYGLAGPRLAVQNVLLDKLVVYKNDVRVELQDLVDMI